MRGCSKTHSSQSAPFARHQGNDNSVFFGGRPPLRAFLRLLILTRGTSNENLVALVKFLEPQFFHWHLRRLVVVTMTTQHLPQAYCGDSRHGRFSWQYCRHGRECWRCGYSGCWWIEWRFGRLGQCGCRGDKKRRSSGDRSHGWNRWRNRRKCRNRSHRRSRGHSRHGSHRRSWAVRQVQPEREQLREVREHQEPQEWRDRGIWRRASIGTTRTRERLGGGAFRNPDDATVVSPKSRQRDHVSYWCGLFNETTLAKQKRRSY